jgi:hypothetical protein
MTKRAWVHPIADLPSLKRIGISHSEVGYNEHLLHHRCGGRDHMNRLVDIDRHPFFVFGERRVCLLQITEFTRFVRRTRNVHEQRPEFGCFRSVSLCGEHLTGPFYGTRTYTDLPLPTRRDSIYRR